MASWKGVLLLALGAFAVPALRAGEAPTPEELVRKLGAADFETRQEAAEKLEALGEKAREALLKARRSEVPEIHATAVRLLTRLNPAQLLVQVVDEDGKPYPNLKLSGGLYPESGVCLEEWLSLETDAEGIVRLKNDQGGHHWLKLDAVQWPAWNEIALNSVTLALRSGENRMFWVQPRGATVKGRVVSAKTGEPIEDAEIMVRREDGESPAAIFNSHWSTEDLRTDAKGEFSIANVTPASLRVFARHNDYAPAAGPALIASETRAYTLDEPIKLMPKTVAWGKLRVQVLDQDGKPAKGAKASLRLSPLRGTEGELNADEMVWLRRLQNRRPVALNANDEGWVETELMEPGAYRLVLQTGDPAQVEQRQNVLVVQTVDPAQVEQRRNVSWIDFGEVQVKAGETVSPSGKPVVKSGSLSCRLKSVEERQRVRVFALRLDDPDVKQWMSRPAARQPWILNNNQNEQSVDMPNQEVELRNLMPGPHVLGIHSKRDNRIGWVFGVEIKADERTTVPEIDLTEWVDAKEALAPRTLSGVLLGESGTPLQCNTNWTLRSRGGGSSRSGTAANFQIDVKFWDSLTFTCSGYRPFTIDLRKPVPNPNNVVVQLVKQQFGGVMVTVKGPDGKLLEDASVMPISAVRKKPRLERAVITDPEGRARLSGLAFGPRQVVATLDGYYLPEPANVDIEAGQTKELTVTLQPGKSVAGRVVFPAGVDPKQVLVRAKQPRFCRIVHVDEQGRFEFTGLAPGPVKLRAQAPGLFSEESPVTAGAAGETVLKLGKLATVLLDLGAGAKSGQLKVLKSGVWNPMNQASMSVYMFTSVDGNGKVVVPYLMPGSYDLLYRPDQAGPSGRQGLAYLIPSGLKVEGGEAVAVRKVEWRPGTAALKFQLEYNTQRPFLEVTSEDTRADLLLESAAACVSMDLFDYLPQKTWFVKGTPPEGFPSANEAQSLMVSQLPAGEYRIHQRTATVDFNQQKSILLKTVTLKDGETLDIGKLSLQPADLGTVDNADTNDSIGADEQEQEVDDH